MLSVTDARARRVCRVCEKTVVAGGVQPDWPFKFDKLLHPERVTLNFGEEFAHTDCLAAAGASPTSEGGGRPALG